MTVKPKEEKVPVQSDAHSSFENQNFEESSSESDEIFNRLVNKSFF